MKFARRRFVQLLLTSSAAASLTGCFGSFQAIQWVYGFNKGISSSKFIQWLVFLVLNIIPVYGVAALIDVWILNSLEFWFGGSGVSKSDDQDEEKVVDLGPGEKLYMRKNHARGVLEMHYEGKGKEVALLLEMQEGRARLLDSRGEVLAHAGEREDGGLEVYSGGRLIEAHDAHEVREAVDSYETGGAEATAAWAAARVSPTRHGYTRR